MIEGFGGKNMKEIRDMDGIYFRVQRDGKWENLCFSDLTSEEQDRFAEYTTGKPIIITVIRGIAEEIPTERSVGLEE